MNEPGSLPSPEQGKSKRASRRRGCLLIGLIVLVMLVPGLYWLENYSGPRALKEIVAQYEQAGLSLEPSTFLPRPVPAEENFGATPLLDGIMYPNDGTKRGDATRARRRVLYDLLQTRWHDSGDISKPRPRPATRLAGRPVKKPPVTGLPNLLADKLEWDKIRSYLDDSINCTPPPEEPSDVVAICQAMEVHAAMFSELKEAAHRPYAQFTPAPIERASEWREGSNYILELNGVESLGRLLLLRVRSAIALGSFDEAVPLLRVIWRLRAACLAESRLHQISRTLEEFWTRGARSLTGAAGIKDRHLLELAAIPGNDWSPEKEMIQTLRGEAALIKRRRLPPEDMFHGLSDYQESMVKFGPSGWVDQNIATVLKEQFQFVIRPLQMSGFRELPETCHAREEYVRGKWRAIWPYRFLMLRIGGQYIEPPMIWTTMNTRLTLLAIGMERYRLKHGRYPADSAALIPDCIAAIPPDIDGAPLRLTTSPDGANAVIYSIGWNLTDDWHGTIPPAYKPINWMANDDWPLALPFPPP